MDIFGNDKKMRGCFTMINYGGTNFKGFSLKLPGGDDLTTNELIVTGVGFVEAEKFMVVPCFNNISHTYGFGHDPSASSITVDFLGFLTKQSGTEQSSVIAYMASSYADARLSVSKKQASLFCGPGTPIKGFVVRLESNTSNQESNIQGFRMQLLMVEPQCANR